MLTMSGSRVDLNQRPKESLADWSARFQLEIKAQIDAKRKSGASINKILLLLPPRFLEKLFAATFACPVHEAKILIKDELRKIGFISFFGVCVISNASILYPRIDVLGDLREAKRRTKLEKSKMFGGKPRSKDLDKW